MALRRGRLRPHRRRAGRPAPAAPLLTLLLLDAPPRFTVDGSGTCTDSSTVRPRRAAQAAAGAFRLCTWLGVLLVLYAGFTLFGTGVSTDRQQRRLLGGFEASLAGGTEPAALGAVPTALDAAAPTPPVGEAVAILKIPKLGLEQAVVEGTRFGDLAKGPGHYVDTPLPGDPGNAGIAGHRTTYGAPFFRLPELDPGDLILVTTRRGTSRFRVRATSVVKPSQRSVLDPTATPTLTLTTCHPAFRATQRFVVHADLRLPAALPRQAELPSDDATRPVAVGTSLTPVASPTRAATVITATADDGAGAPRRVAIAALALVAVWGALRLVARRHRILAWLALGLPLGVAMVAVFDAVNRILADAL